MEPKLKKKDLTSREIKAIKAVKQLIQDFHHDMLCAELPSCKIKYSDKYSNALTLTAAVFGVHRSTVIRVSKPQSSSENSSPTPKLRPQNTPMLCDSFSLMEIRRVTLNFYAEGKYPTGKDILQKCLENENFPKVGLSTFRKWMKKAKFKYTKMNKKPVYLERQDIVAHRELYLRGIRRYRQESYKVFYVDETWANPDQVPSKCWLFHVDADEVRRFRDIWYRDKVLIDMNGFAGGFKVIGGTGRVIINHAGSEDGFVQGVEDIFVSKKDTSDYHNAMNSEHYIHWFQKLLDNVPDKSVIVLDQAPYHRRRVPETVMPKLYWKKSDIIENLLARNVSLPPHVAKFDKLTKRTLLELSDKAPVKVKYVVEDMAEKCGKNVKVLWLPVAHCEFNPIELIWSFVKKDIAKNNCKGGTARVLELARNAMGKVTPELWAACVRHCIKVEDAMWERDRLVDENFFVQAENPLVICVPGDNSESESSDDDECSSDED